MSMRSAAARRAWALGLCWTVSAWCVGAPGEAHAATILTFDQVREAGGGVVATVSGFAVPQDYGDRVTGSPMDVPGGQFTTGSSGMALRRTSRSSTSAALPPRTTPRSHSGRMAMAT